MICFQQADKSIGRLSADCSNDLKGKAEAGFVGGFDKGLKGFLKVFMTFQISEVLFSYSKGVL